MKDRLIAAMLSGFLMGGILGYLIADARFRSAPPLANDVTEHTFSVPLSEVDLAVKRAFADGRYFDIRIQEAHLLDGLVPNWHATNGYVLYSFHEPITSVTIGQSDKKMPYLAYFHITLTPADNQGTTVKISTILSEVIVGKQPSLHGGWANRYRAVPPISRERCNVLMAIVNVLFPTNMAASQPLLPKK